MGRAWVRTARRWREARNRWWSLADRQADRERGPAGTSHRTPGDSTPENRTPADSTPENRTTGRLKALATGLQGRLFVFTFLFVMVAESVVFVPSLAMFFQNWLGERVAAAQIAALVHDASRERIVDGSLEANVLERTGVSVVILRRGDVREALFMVDNPPTPDLTIDLSQKGFAWAVPPAFSTLIAPRGRTLHVLGVQLETGEALEVVLPEEPLRSAMVDYCTNIAILSLIIGLIAAGLLYLTTYLELVRPIRSLITSIVTFRQRPEDMRPLPTVSRRYGELGEAARALQGMQGELRSALHQKTRLAALGTAVSKINHDLRNMLASAQLITDRLAESEDPTVRRLAPTLVRNIDRAVTLCTQTLKFGRANEPEPQLQACALAPICADVASNLGLADDSPARLTTAVAADLKVFADPDHVFRILFNLSRNAAQAIEAQHARLQKQDPDGNPPSRGTIAIEAQATSDGSAVIIDVSDDGPGLPENTRNHLFEAFVSSAQKGGTGLGLTIARDLARAQGGDLTLLSSGSEGTTFRLKLPPAPDRA